MIRKTSAAKRQLEITVEASSDRIVVPLRLNVLPRHREYLEKWIEAGGRAGLLDAAIDTETRPTISIWVRESPDPAYVIFPRLMKWIVVDQTTTREIGAFRVFEEALYAIRPIAVSSGNLAS